jgi:molybdopterin-containing oxidoreductase family iron-sulfur binding subunit
MNRHLAIHRPLTRQLDQEKGRRLWRALDEPARLEEALERELPDLGPLPGQASRREVLRVMAASLALAGLGGCDPVQPEERALPHVGMPEFGAAGEPRLYAAASLLNGYAIPLLVETVDGRPIKVEGNPEHPLTRGGTDLFAQAAVLDLYDPDRSRTTAYLGEVRPWPEAQRDLLVKAQELERRGGEGLAILSGTITSPTTVRQLRRLQDRFPALRQFRHEPVGDQRRQAASLLAFGRPLDQRYRLERARAVLALEADPLGPGPAQIANARGFSDARRAALEEGRAMRLLAVESTPTLTGAKATERWPADSALVEAVVVALARQLGIGPAEAVDLPLGLRSWLLAASAELEQAGKAALVALGHHLPPRLQALGYRINERLGALHHTIELTEPAAWQPDGVGDLEDLAEALRGGSVDTLLMLDTNPLYTAPDDLDLAALLRQVPLTVHLGQYQDETAAASRWHIPMCHAFEGWRDARAVDGTATILQPTIRPLHASHTEAELLATLAGDPDVTPYDAVRTTWRDMLGEEGFEARWAKLLSDGFAAETAAARVTDAPRPIEVAPPPATAEAGTLEAVFRPDPSIWDGRFANNPWLQELPKPLSKLTWDNVAAISPALAAAQRLANGDRVRISAGERLLEAPVWILPGQAERTVTLYLGYGRKLAGRIGNGVGYDAYRLRREADPWRLDDVTLQAVGAAAALATTQLHRTMAGHDLIRQTTPEAVRAGTPVAPPFEEPSLYPDWPYAEESWGMVIDLDTCIGCNACVVACMAENNVPVVGKEQVAMGREMHWLRVDTYYEGAPGNPETHFQPVPCMHCEQAPCEVGCPVNATVHGPEGLNQMVYNRCVGTRTCASYCPYKVRHFNFFDYAGGESEGRVPQRNPEVTVRARGVMEKCTYCVQRISRARIAAKTDERAIRDGEVVTACQGACPTRAIVFGDLNDPDSAIRRAKASPRNYALLEELGVRPRTTYLAKVAPSGRRGSEPA